MKINKQRRLKRSTGRRGLKSMALPGTGSIVDIEMNKRLLGLVSNQVNKNYLSKASRDELLNGAALKSGCQSHVQLATIARQTVLYSVLIAEMLDRSQRCIVEKMEQNDNCKCFFLNSTRKI